MNCHGTNKTISCSFDELRWCDSMTCMGMSPIHIISLALSALALCDSILCYRKEFGCFGGRNRDAPKGVGRTESIVIVLTHFTGSVCMVAILLTAVVPRTYQNKAEYQTQTELWLGLCILRWSMACGLHVLWYRYKKIRILPAETVENIARV